MSVTTDAKASPGFDRIWTLMRKEWSETLRNRVTLMTLIVPSIIFTLLPLGVIFLTKQGGVLEQIVGPETMSAADVAEMQRLFPQFNNMNSSEFAQAIALTSLQTMFLILPLLVPMMIATYSIIGEKLTRSLEPLLVTPIETWELLLGKGLAAAIPGVVVSWLSYLIVIVLAPFGTTARIYSGIILRPSWLTALLVLGPLLSLLAVILALIVSSRARDAQAAQQISSIVVLPVVALMIGQVVGVVQLSVTLVLIAASIVVLIDMALIFAAVRLFQRESILTRWK